MNAYEAAFSGLSRPTTGPMDTRTTPQIRQAVMEKWDPHNLGREAERDPSKRLFILMCDELQGPMTNLRRTELLRSAQRGPHPGYGIIMPSDLSNAGHEEDTAVEQRKIASLSVQTADSLPWRRPGQPTVNRLTPLGRACFGVGRPAIGNMDRRSTQQIRRAALARWTPDLRASTEDQLTLHLVLLMFDELQGPMDNRRQAEIRDTFREGLTNSEKTEIAARTGQVYPHTRTGATIPRPSLSLALFSFSEHEDEDGPSAVPTR